MSTARCAFHPLFGSAKRLWTEIENNSAIASPTLICQNYGRTYLYHHKEKLSTPRLRSLLTPFVYLRNLLHLPVSFIFNNSSKLSHISQQTTTFRYCGDRDLTIVHL